MRVVWLNFSWHKLFLLQSGKEASKQDVDRTIRLTGQNLEINPIWTRAQRCKLLWETVRRYSKTEVTKLQNNQTAFFKQVYSQKLSSLKKKPYPLLITIRVYHPILRRSFSILLVRTRKSIGTKGFWLVTHVAFFDGLNLSCLHSASSKLDSPLPKYSQLTGGTS